MIAGLAVNASAKRDVAGSWDTKVWTVTHEITTPASINYVEFSGRFQTDIPMGLNGMLYFADVGVGSLVRLDGVDRWGLPTGEFAQGYVERFFLGGNFGHTILRRDGPAHTSGTIAVGTPANKLGHYDTFANSGGSMVIGDPVTSGAAATATRQATYNTRIHNSNTNLAGGLFPNQPVLFGAVGTPSAGGGGIAAWETAGGRYVTNTFNNVVEQSDFTPFVTTALNDAAGSTPGAAGATNANGMSLRGARAWGPGGVLYRASTTAGEVDVRFGPVNLEVRIQVNIPAGASRTAWDALKRLMQDADSDVAGIAIFGDVLMNEGYQVATVLSTAANNGMWWEDGNIVLSTWRQFDHAAETDKGVVEVNLKNNAAVQIVGDGPNPGTRVVPAGSGVFTTAEMVQIADAVAAGSVIKATATLRSNQWGFGTTRVLVGKDYGKDAVVRPNLVFENVREQVATFEFIIDQTMLLTTWFEWNVTGLKVVYDAPINPDVTRAEFWNDSNWATHDYAVVEWRFEVLEGGDTGIRGDVNGDGVTNMADALLALRLATGQSPAGANVAAAKVVSGASVEGVTMADVLAILMIATLA
jgi:hypothetical protein